jgi:hypothetical protein
MVRIQIWARPGSSRDAVSWDEWRGRWVVSVTAPAVGGKANEALRVLIAHLLGIPAARVQWVRSGTGRSKVLEVEGLTDEEVCHRLSKNDPSNTVRSRTALEV